MLAEPFQQAFPPVIRGFFAIDGPVVRIGIREGDRIDNEQDELCEDCKKLPRLLEPGTARPNDMTS